MPIKKYCDNRFTIFFNSEINNLWVDLYYNTSTSTQ